MQKRLKFLPGKQKEFLEEIYKKSRLSTKELAEIADICPRSFRDWRREKLTLTLKTAETFCKRFSVRLPEEKEIMMERWSIFKRNVSKKGGIALFKKYGSPATKEGCHKGGKKAFAILRRKGIIPSCKSYYFPNYFCKELAEYVGIVLGDGGINKGQCAITLNSEADRSYVDFVSDLGQKLFTEKPKLLKRKDSKAIVLYYNGVSMVKFLTKIGLKIGNKVKHQVDVPDWIKNNKKYKVVCLRGLMDTDGGVFLHKYKVNGKEYIYKKICFTNRSLPLLFYVKNTLEELGFTPKIIDKVANKKIWLYNSVEVERYLACVGTNNERLLKVKLLYNLRRVARVV